MERSILYAGDSEPIIFPEIRKTKYTKDFSWGFYCMRERTYAYRAAFRRGKIGVLNCYSFLDNGCLNILKFEEMNDEWLDFIGGCRRGYVHDYDIVEGPMVDDTIWDYVNEFFADRIDRETFWLNVLDKQPAIQLSFHTLSAIDCLTYEGSEQVVGENGR